MKLIDILLQELPRRGGWPSGSMRCMQTEGLYVTFPDIGDHCDFIAKYMADGNRVVTCEEYKEALSASQKSEWNGEGLPPVGCRIEYTCTQPDIGHPAIETGKWYSGTVIAYYDGAVWTSDNGIRQLRNTTFRPIRSDADRKRDAAVSAMLNAQSYGGQDVYCDIYDAIAAGKIPGIRIE